MHRLVRQHPLITLPSLQLNFSWLDRSSLPEDILSWKGVFLVKAKGHHFLTASSVRWVTAHNRLIVIFSLLRLFLLENTLPASTTQITMIIVSIVPPYTLSARIGIAGIPPDTFQERPGKIEQAGGILPWTDIQSDNGISVNISQSRAIFSKTLIMY